MSMTEIVPGLYLSGLEEVMCECERHTAGITHILNVAAEIEADRAPEYVYKHVGIGDDDGSDDISDILGECVDWVERALSGEPGNRVMVHCWSGVSRSVCVVLAYLVHRRGYTLGDAYAMVLLKRPIIDPWPRYLSQLNTWRPAPAVAAPAVADGDI